jgi:hypothetical protein
MKVNKKLASRIIKKIMRRPPDFIIGGHERPYLLRWFVIPRNPIINVYFHAFRRSAMLSGVALSAVLYGMD